MMSNIRIIPLLLTVIIATGCAHANYRVSVHNDTSTKITEAKVKLSGGELLTFGTMDPRVGAGIWPVRGPLQKESLIEWKAADEPKSAKATVSCGVGDDSVIFVIRSNDTVTVVTGKDLYEYRKP